MWRSTRNFRPTRHGAEAFRPWLERCAALNGGQPTAEQILALKVCDPAMGSGAFLVAVCRYLAGWLVQAWERDGYPEGFRQDVDKDTVVRRLVAQRCLYGVDKNPFAVNLARLSLWLVTLGKDQSFTFVDHALKCGDSLVGYCVRQIQTAMHEVQLGFLNEQNQVFAQMGGELRLPEMQRPWAHTWTNLTVEVETSMRTVNVHEAKTQFSRLIDAAHAGETILVAKDGKPWARLVPLEPAQPRRQPGVLRGLLQLPSTEELLAPLPPEELDAVDAPLPV